MPETKIIDGMTCVYHVDCVTVMDCYKLNLTYIAKFCLKLYIGTPVKYRRTYHSWEYELEAHIVLYRMGLFKEHTKDADLNDDEPKWRLLCYRIICATIGKYFEWKDKEFA